MKPEPDELRVGMRAQEVPAALAGMLETVPHAVGVNNHEGSRATSDPALMDALMPALRERGLFFIDSRTAAATVAYDAAATLWRGGGVAQGFPRRRANARSDRKRSSNSPHATPFATARPSPSAIRTPQPSPRLPKMCRRSKRSGIRLVFASDLVH